MGFAALYPSYDSLLTRRTNLSNVAIEFAQRLHRGGVLGGADLPPHLGDTPGEIANRHRKFRCLRQRALFVDQILPVQRKST